MRADLARIEQSRALALPFPGKYYLTPRRNYFKLGAAFYWAGYPERALPYLAETLRTHPENWKALHAMARIQLELGRNKDALRNVPAGDRAQARLSAGYSWAQAKPTPGATTEPTRRRMFQRALEFDPKCADAMNQLGTAGGQCRTICPARAAGSSSAIEAQQDHPGAINNLGVLYAKTGQPNDAIAAFRYGMKMNPDDDELYLNLARIYVTMGERETGSGRAERIDGTEAGKRHRDEGASANWRQDDSTDCVC